jgi:hypothetical protein
VIKRVLFLTAILVSFPRWVLADDVSFQGVLVVGSPAVPDPSRSNFLNGGADVTARYLTISGNRQYAWDTVVQERFDASSRAGFSSIVQVDDGIIGISVPEPETMGTLAIGLAIIAGLVRLKSSKSNCFLH